MFGRGYNFCTVLFSQNASQILCPLWLVLVSKIFVYQQFLQAVNSAAARASGCFHALWPFTAPVQRLKPSIIHPVDLLGQFVGVFVQSICRNGLFQGKLRMLMAILPVLKVASGPCSVLLPIVCSEWGWWSLWHKGPCAPPARWAGCCPAKGFLQAVAFYKAGSFSLLGSAETYQVSSTLLSSVMLPSGVFGGFWHVIKQIKKRDETVAV